MRKIHWGHVAEFIAVSIACFVAVWFLASFVDVNLHNDYFRAGYGDFAPWNMFVLIFD